MAAPEYTRQRNALVSSRPIPETEQTLVFSAEYIRQERSGIHARISIAVGQSVLAWTNGNIERDEDRVRLANSAHKRLRKEETAAYSASDLKHDLDVFTEGVWPAFLAVHAPEEMAGAEDSAGPAYLLKPYVVQGGGTILFAPPGRGKSYLALLISISIDEGLATIWPAKKTKVLFINLERSKESVAKRLGNVNAALGLPRNRKLYTLNARGRSLSDVADAARRGVDEHSVGLVVLDSLSRTGLGDMNDNRVGNSGVDTLNGLCETWLALGHTPRKEEDHLFGSQMYDAGADALVQVRTQQNEDYALGLGLQITKANDLPKPPMELLALDFDPDRGLKGWRRPRVSEFPEIAAGKKVPLPDEIAAALLDMPNACASAAELALVLRRNKEMIGHVLANDPRFVAIRKEGRVPIYAVRARLPS